MFNEKHLLALLSSKPAATALMAEVQGDHVATVMAARVLLGYAVQRSGG